jgi:hypothetical protein
VLELLQWTSIRFFLKGAAKSSSCYRQLTRSIISISQQYCANYFLDDFPLTHKANQKFRLKLKFRVGQFRQQPDEHTTFQSLEDGVDPETRPPGLPSHEVNFDGFINHKVLFIHGCWHSIRDVIKHASDVQGGVHRSDPKEQHRPIAAYSASLTIGGLPAAIRQPKGIGRVALRGLKPLIVAVEGPRA